MRYMRTLVGGLMLSLGNESCHQNLTSLRSSSTLSMYSTAVSSYAGLHTREVAGISHCVGRVYGLLPLLARGSIEHQSIELSYYEGGPRLWALRVRGPAWSLPCSVTGRSQRECSSSTYGLRLRVWCEINEFIDQKKNPFCDGDPSRGSP